MVFCFWISSCRWTLSDHVLSGPTTVSVPSKTAMWSLVQRSEVTQKSLHLMLFSFTLAVKQFFLLLFLLFLLQSKIPVGIKSGNYNKVSISCSVLFWNFLPRQPTRTYTLCLSSFIKYLLYKLKLSKFSLLPSFLQYSQAANTVSECEQAKDLGAINSTLRSRHLVLYPQCQ